MAEGFVQVPADSIGKKIDTTELTRADGTVVERQRVVLADTEVAGQVVGVREGHLQTAGLYDEQILEVLLDIKAGIELLINQEIKR